MSKLPAEWVEEGLKLAEGCHVFGLPLHTLTPEEMLAVAAHGWHQYRQASQSAHEKAMALIAMYKREAP